MLRFIAMLPTQIPFTSSCDKKNIPVTRKAKRSSLIDGQSASYAIATLRASLMSRPNTTGAKRFLLQRIVSRSQSPPFSTITDLTNSAMTQAPDMLPTIHEEVIPSSLSTIWPSVDFYENRAREHELAAKNGLCHLCNESSRQRRIMSEELERDRLQFLNQSTHMSSASFLSGLPPPIPPSDPESEDIKNILLMSMLSSITGPRSYLDFRILTELEKEKRKADFENLRRTPVDQEWTDSPPSAPQSRSPSPIIILSDLEREKREAHPLALPRSRKSLFSTKKGYVHYPLFRAYTHHPPSSQSLSPQLIIISNPEKDKREGLPRFTQRVVNSRNVVTAALAPKRVPNIQNISSDSSSGSFFYSCRWPQPRRFQKKFMLLLLFPLPLPQPPTAQMYPLV